MSATIAKCSNCNKELQKGEREVAAASGVHECAECRFHTFNGTRTIKKFNAWLRRGREEGGEQCSSQH